MSSSYVSVDLSTLAAPSIVETLDFETIVAAMLADLQSRDTTFTALLESDPAYKVLEVCAYRELLMRQRVNDACNALLLAYATGTNLDQLGANSDLERLTVTAVDTTTVPPTAAVMETDTAFRLRIQQAPQGYSCAGPTGAYQFFALSSSGDVRDVGVTTPLAGTVLVSVLSQTAPGTAPAATLAAVTAALTADSARPLCDTVVVQTAAIAEYSVSALLTIPSTLDAATIIAAATTALQTYTVAQWKVNKGVAVALVSAACAVTGVQNVALQAPGITADIVADPLTAPYCTGITITTQVAS